MIAALSVIFGVALFVLGVLLGCLLNDLYWLEKIARIDEGRPQ